MFNIIIIVIAVVLVAAITAATLYYGGSSYHNQGRVADAATILNGGSQIKGAVEVYRNDHAGSNPATLNDLVTTSYLKSVPPGTWNYDGQYATQDVAQQDTCYDVNVKLGYGRIIPTCADAAYLHKPVCCTTDSTAL
jgi:hypothetical protein